MSSETNLFYDEELAEQRAAADAFAKAFPTTVLGTCDVCEGANRELARCFVTGIETFACDACRGVEPLTPTAEACADVRAYMAAKAAE